MAHSEVRSIADQLDDLSNDGSAVPEGDSAFGSFSWLVRANDLAPPWWSLSRDQYLSEFWKTSDHLAAAVYNAQSKLAAIPFVIEPVDPSVVLHQEQAEAVYRALYVGSEFLQGIQVALEKFYEDYLTQDNGGFLEILGEGNADGPIIGQPLAVRHLDSQRCTRTSDRVYPVKVLGGDGKQYKMHWTRVIYMSQMPSSRRQMNGVGFCAVSRTLDIAQNLVDVIRYKGERLGSRPPNQIILGKGISGRAIMTAMRTAEQEMSNRGYSKYARSIAIGSDNPDIDLDVINLHHMDPFNEKDATQLAMYAIAAGFGMDVTELWPVAGVGGGNSAAQLQNMRVRGKLPAQVTEALAHQFNTKFLPPHLKLRFDFRDDEEDQQRAIIRDIRGRQRERDIGNGTITVRSARQMMARDGDIPRSMLSELEWSSGRDEGGQPLYALFFSQDEPHKTMLDLGVDNPLDFGSIDADEMMSTVAEARRRVLIAMNDTRAKRLSAELRKDWATLEWYLRELKAQFFAAPAEDDQAAAALDVNDDEEHEGNYGSTSLGRQRKPASEKSLSISMSGNTFYDAHSGELYEGDFNG